MTVIVDLFTKLQTPESVVGQMSKKSRFWGNFDKHNVKRVETLLKSDQQNLWHIYWSMWRQLSLEECLLVIILKTAC